MARCNLAVSPGPNCSSEPSSIRTLICPDIIYCVSGASPGIGFDNQFDTFFPIPSEPMTKKFTIGFLHALDGSPI